MNQRLLFFGIMIALLCMQAGPAWGLFAGLAFSLLLGSPYSDAQLSRVHKPLLKYAIVGLGFGMSIQEVLSTGAEGLVITFITLSFTILAGWVIAQLLGISPKVAFLISSGTAICGGSAIAAVSPAIDAKSKDMSIALGVVFVLNAVALFAFPIMGKHLGLSNTQFAWWSAMAIHDTSSVVGTASQFGTETLALATTIKLTRALWIIPFSLVAARLSKGKKGDFPYFILFFVIAALANSYIPFIQPAGPYLVMLSKSAFTIVLFLVGLGINKEALKETGPKPFIFGTLLWAIIVMLSLACVIYFFCEKYKCFG